MDEIEAIIAKAMSASKAWPVVFEAGTAAELARAAVVALKTAGFVVVPSELPEANAEAAVRFAMAVSIGSQYQWPDYMRDLYIAMIDVRPK